MTKMSMSPIYLMCSWMSPISQSPQSLYCWQLPISPISSSISPISTLQHPQSGYIQHSTSLYCAQYPNIPIWFEYPQNFKLGSLNFQSNQLSCSLSFSPRDQVGNWEEDQKSRRTIYYNNQVCSQSWPIFLFLFCFSCLHVYLAISNKNFKERKHELEYGRQVKSRVEHSKSGRIAHTRQTREEWKRLLSLSSRNEAVTLCWLEQIFVDQS